MMDTTQVTQNEKIDAVAISLARSINYANRVNEELDILLGNIRTGRVDDTETIRVILQKIQDRYGKPLMEAKANVRTCMLEEEDEEN